MNETYESIAVTNTLKIGTGGGDKHLKRGGSFPPLNRRGSFLNDYANVI